MILFNDVSYAQGLYDMDSDLNPMIMMKASGFYTVAKTPYLDSQLVRNYANAIRLGKIPFMYHFEGGADPVVEASYYISAISPITVGDGYALDFETDLGDGQTNPNWVMAFLDHFVAVVGTCPWWYIDRSLRGKGDWSAVQAKYGEWMAAPDVPFTADIPNVGVYIAQQGPIVNGHDTDAFFGTIDELRAYTHQNPTAVESVPILVAPTAPVPTPPVVVPPVVTPPTPEPTPEPTPTPSEPTAPTEPPVVVPPTVVPPKTPAVPTPSGAAGSWLVNLIKKIWRVLWSKN